METFDTSKSFPFLHAPHHSNSLTNDLDPLFTNKNQLLCAKNNTIKLTNLPQLKLHSNPNPTQLQLMLRNVQSLLEPTKQSALIYEILIYKPHIYFLTETWASNPKWKSSISHTLKQYVIYDDVTNDSNHSGFGSGTAIIIHRSLQIYVIKTKIFPNRCTSILLHHKKHFTILLISIYHYANPKRNQATKLRQFILDTVNDTRTSFPDLYIIIAGDFNATPNPSKDRHPYSTSLHAHESRKIEYLQHLNLIDVWRQEHPDKLQYTHKDYRSQARLDQFHMSPTITTSKNTIQNTYLGENDHHSLVISTIILPDISVTKPPKPITKPPRFIYSELKKENLIKYIEQIETLLKDFPNNHVNNDSPEPPTINDRKNLLTQYIIKAAQDHIPIRQQSNFKTQVSQHIKTWLQLIKLKHAYPSTSNINTITTISQKLHLPPLTITPDNYQPTIKQLLQYIKYKHQQQKTRNIQLNIQIREREYNLMMKKHNKNIMNNGDPFFTCIEYLTNKVTSEIYTSPNDVKNHVTTYCSKLFCKTSTSLKVEQKRSLQNTTLT